LKVLESLGHDGTNYPLALGAIPGDTLSLRLTYDLMRIKTSDAQHLLDSLCHLIQSLPRIAHTPLAAIALLEAPEEQQLINQSIHPTMQSLQKLLQTQQLIRVAD
jgi:hypothetical protein